MKNKRFPNYPDDSDYTTNAPSYYDELARKQKLIELLSKRIWEYDEELAKRFEAWDKNLEDFPEDVKVLFQKWLDNGTLDHIINDTIFNWKLDTTIFEQFRDVTTAQLQQSVIGIDAKDFGFIGDGETNNVTPLDNLIKHINTIGGNVLVTFGEGNYFFGTATVTPLSVSNVTFRGLQRDLTRFTFSSGTYLRLQGVNTVEKNFGLERLTVKYEQPDMFNVPIVVEHWSGVNISDVVYDSGCTLIQMGTATKMAYGLRLSGMSVRLANKGKPFILLKNGAGFYWNDFTNIYHNEADVPLWNTTSTMTTMAGTNVINIEGDWDTVELSIFAEKMYDIVYISSSTPLIVFNIRIANSVFDYIRNSIINGDIGASSSINTVNITDTYLSTWEGHGFDLRANQSDIRNITLNNVYSVFTGKSGFNYQGVSAALTKATFNNCRFIGTSRLGEEYDAIAINNVYGLSLNGGTIGSDDVAGNVLWGKKAGLQIGAWSGHFKITSVTSPKFEIPLILSSEPQFANRNALVRENVFTGDDVSDFYAGAKRTDFATAPYYLGLSGVPWYNTTPYELEIIYGGTITSMSYNNVPLPLSGTITLKPGDYYTITYENAQNLTLVYNVKQ